MGSGVQGPTLTQAHDILAQAVEHQQQASAVRMPASSRPQNKSVASASEELRNLKQNKKSEKEKSPTAYTVAASLWALVPREGKKNIWVEVRCDWFYTLSHLTLSILAIWMSCPIQILCRKIIC